MFDRIHEAPIACLQLTYDMKYNSAESTGMSFCSNLLKDVVLNSVVIGKVPNSKYLVTGLMTRWMMMMIMMMMVDYNDDEDDDEDYMARQRKQI